jgi:branched-chain amino acid transport system substrate-binding protein
VAALVALAAVLGIAAGIAARSPRPSPVGVTASADATAGCTTNRGCVAASGGQPSVCRRDTGVCVALASEDCRVLAQPGDVENDATVWIGAMFPISGPNAPDWGLRSMNAVDLARRDFAETAGGLPPTRPGGPPRPLAVVACDDAAQAARAAAHLVEEVRVPAIVGFARSKEVIDLAGSLFVPRGVLALAANTATMLRSIPRPEGGPRLVWRTTTSVDMVMVPRTAFVAEVLEPAVRAAPGALRPGEPMRIALVRVNNPSGLSYADIVVSSLRWNGRGVIENGDAFRQFAVPDSLSEELDDDDRARFAAEIAAFAPHLVLDGGGLDGRLIQSVERAWPKGRPWAPPPRYVTGEIAAPNILAMLRAQPDVRGRIFGVDTVTSTPAMGKFVLRYNEVFTPKITGRETAGAPYDAVYAVAYAAAALGAEPVTGPGLSRALSRLRPPGEPIDVGPGGIYPALAALGSGKNVDLVGTVTSLDFDPETGDATADFAVYCVGPTSFGDARDVVESGLVYDARARALRGTMRCGPAPR